MLFLKARQRHAKKESRVHGPLASGAGVSAKIGPRQFLVKLLHDSQTVCAPDSF